LNEEFDPAFVLELKLNRIALAKSSSLLQGQPSGDSSDIFHADGQSVARAEEVLNNADGLDLEPDSSYFLGIGAQFISA
jgi:hypothetical protein